MKPMCVKERTLGTHRFQRAGSAKDVLIGIKRLRSRFAWFDTLLDMSMGAHIQARSGLPCAYHLSLHAGSDAYPGYSPGVTRLLALLQRQSSGFSHSPALTGLFSI